MFRPDIELKSSIEGTARDGVLRLGCVAVHPGHSTHVGSATVLAADGERVGLFRCAQMTLW